MKIALSLKLTYSIFVSWVIPIYWKQYGPANYLWFSDVALILLVPALWLESKLFFSALAVSVVLLELLWNVDFFVRLLTRSQLVGLSDYMFDSTISRSIRALSLFHVFLPAILIWYVYRLGYDSRAFVVQTFSAWVVLLLSFFLTKPKDNINWVYGFGKKPQTRVPKVIHLLLLMLGLPVLVYLPSHLVLKRLFGT
jgi:hypothetical protein